jgi:CRISPR/Cas system-associated protein Cas7 (RAMP superfamily)
MANVQNKLTHVAGTFLIRAEGAFLNGSVAETYEGNPITTPKTVQEFNNRIPYVSAQAWRRWLRETYKEEYPDDPTTPIETKGTDTGEAKEKYTTKKVGTAVDPVLYAEHDIFGYMTAKEGQGSKGVKATIRSAPFQSSILMSIRKSGWEGIDKGYVHPQSVAVSYYQEILEDLLLGKTKLSKQSKPLVEAAQALTMQDVSREELVLMLEKTLKDALAVETDEKAKGEIDMAIRKVLTTVPSSLPYTTRFYNTHLQGVFGLAFNRLGVFRNSGDKEELEADLVEKYMKAGMIEKVPTRDKNAVVYGLKDRGEAVHRAKKLLRSLAVLRGGAKQAQFGTDVSPKVLIVAGLSCGNLIFNDLFEDTKELVSSPREQIRGDGNDITESKVTGGTRIKVDSLKQVISDYAERIVTPVYIGLRSGYLSKESQAELIKFVKNPEWHEGTFGNPVNGTRQMPEILLASPIDAVEKLLAKMEELGNGNGIS